MSKSIRNIKILINVSLLCGAVYFAYGLWRSAKDTAYESCLASIAGDIEMMDRSKSLVAQSNDWKFLNNEEVSSLLSQTRGGDCGKYPDKTLDIWNRKINIALRKPATKLELFVWSNGHDGVSGTDDDLVIPWNEKVPKQ